MASPAVVTSLPAAAIHNIINDIPNQPRSSSPVPSLSEEAEAEDCATSTASSAGAASTQTKASVRSAAVKSTTGSATSSTSTLARLSAIAKATTKLHFISALIPALPGTKAATLIQIQAPKAVMAIDFKPLVLTPVDFSLTDGTNIPAPVLPESPPLTPVEDKALNKDVDDELDLSSGKDSADAEKGGDKGLPTPSSTQQSPPARKVTGIRRFLSLRSLRGHSSRQQAPASPKGSSSTKLSYHTVSSSRPGTSRSVDSVTLATDNPLVQTLKHRRSAGWFGSSSRRRSAAMSPEALSPKKDLGPPPPTIPELGTVGEEAADMRADELFKDIK